MTKIAESLYSWLSFLPRISFRNILEIIIITFLVYEILFWIKNTRAWTLLKGIAVILGFTVLAYLLQLDTILWIIGKCAIIATTALIIIFQPELRKALEQLGSQNLIAGIFSFDDSKESGGFTEKTINEIVKGTIEMAKVKTGALMVIEQGVSLKEIERTGIEINGLVSSQLLINIFEHNTPLHDGAIVIRGNRIAAATCYLPLSDNMAISKDLGTRHRAAVGISEVSDSLTVVVSEETGRISVAEGGWLRRISDGDELKKILSAALTKDEADKNNRFKIWKGRRKNEGKARK
ncbi:diadenylate cyclase CdaA [Clostridium sp. AM58-1XD]|uniref:diadenylate cyclase CdaA n=1 Tax=Clostridium sp. AM58-1XD TaxID=2292307 RepID=UPI000E4F4C60|nr:diadenylate cyclase CdaA [Clostridium sp. AM58-1XD]RGY96097.1 TIGR00159 family protein [Clostridium sp. AM58-1XD]